MVEVDVCLVVGVDYSFTSSTRKHDTLDDCQGSSAETAGKTDAPPMTPGSPKIDWQPRRVVVGRVTPACLDCIFCIPELRRRENIADRVATSTRLEADIDAFTEVACIATASSVCTIDCPIVSVLQHSRS